VIGDGTRTVIERLPMPKRLTAAKYAIHLIGRLYEATDGKPMAWRMMAVAGSDNAAPWRWPSSAAGLLKGRARHLPERGPATW
jgi:hypothetical protein